MGSTIHYLTTKHIAIANIKFTIDFFQFKIFKSADSIPDKFR